MIYFLAILIFSILVNPYFFFHSFNLIYESSIWLFCLLFARAYELFLKLMHSATNQNVQSAIK